MSVDNVPRIRWCAYLNTLKANESGNAFLLAAIWVCLLMYSTPITADVSTVESTAETTQLNFPDQVELRTLISLVSEQLDLQIVFDDQLANKKITIKAPHVVPTESLRGILESALQINGLALVNDEQPGWLRIVEALDLTRVSGPPTDGPVDGIRAVHAVIHIFELMYADPQNVEAAIQRFLATSRANSFVVPEQRLMTVKFKRVSQEPQGETTNSRIRIYNDGYYPFHSSSCFHYYLFSSYCSHSNLTSHPSDFRNC